MFEPPVPHNERERIAALQRCDSLDTPPDARFDRFSRLVHHALGMPIVLISLIDSNRQWIKSRIGFEATDIPRAVSFCGYTILGDHIFEIPDTTLDPRFVHNPLVIGQPGIRFYAGAPLRNRDGLCLGTLCLMDYQPGRLSDRAKMALQDFADCVASELDRCQEGGERRHTERVLLAKTAELARSNAELEQFAYAISHDLRQPLRMMTSYVRLLERQLSDHLAADTRQMMGFVIDGATRMDQMLVSLLDYSRVGRQGEPLTAVETRAVVDDVLGLLAPAIDDVGAEVMVKGEWPTVQVNRDEFTRLLQNLIDNALKYRSTSRSPRIVIYVQAETQYCGQFLMRG